MAYPSREVKAFCDNLKTLVEVRAGKLHPGGICQCELDSIISHYLKDKDQKTNLANGLFWTIWVQNTIEQVAEPELYKQFRSIYPFPRLFSHVGNLYASPFFILQPYRLYKMPSMDLILEGGKDIWGEVAMWLGSIGRQDIIKPVTESFEEDLKHQHKSFKEIVSLWR